MNYRRCELLKLDTSAVLETKSSKYLKPLTDEMLHGRQRYGELLQSVRFDNPKKLKDKIRTKDIKFSEILSNAHKIPDWKKVKSQIIHNGQEYYEEQYSVLSGNLKSSVASDGSHYHSNLVSSIAPLNEKKQQETLQEHIDRAIYLDETKQSLFFEGVNRKDPEHAFLVCKFNKMCL